MRRSLILTLTPLMLAGAPSAFAQDGGQLFAQRCGECHSSRAFAAWGRKEADEAKRRAWLEGFLLKHYPPPRAERALIIEHIQTQIARP